MEKTYDTPERTKASNPLSLVNHSFLARMLEMSLFQVAAILAGKDSPGARVGGQNGIHLFAKVKSTPRHQLS